MALILWKDDFMLKLNTWAHCSSIATADLFLITVLIDPLYASVDNTQLSLREVNRVGTLYIRNMNPSAWRQKLCPIYTHYTNSVLLFWACSIFTCWIKVTKWGAVKTCQQPRLKLWHFCVMCDWHCCYAKNNCGQCYGSLDNRKTGSLQPC